METIEKNFEPSVLNKFRQKGYIPVEPYLLGKGAYGNVFKFKNEKNNKFVVVKAINIYTEEERDIATNEINVLKKISVKPRSAYYISKIISSLDARNKIYIIEDFIEGSTLLEYMNILTLNDRLNINFIWKLFQNLSETLNYVHSTGIAHKDIKPENIMYCKKSESFKLIDFGLSCIKHQGCFQYVGTPMYASPESMEEESENLNISKLSDVWSLGVVFHELLFGHGPHGKPELTLKDFYKRINDINLGVYSAETSEKHASFSINYLIKRMLTIDWRQRITSDELYQYFYHDSEGCAYGNQILYRPELVERIRKEQKSYNYEFDANDDLNKLCNDYNTILNQN